MPPTLNCDKFVALLMNQQFAVDALISLASKSPYSVSADGTVGTLETVIKQYLINKSKVILISQKFAHKIIKISSFFL